MDEFCLFDCCLHEEKKDTKMQQCEHVGVENDTCTRRFLQRQLWSTIEIVRTNRNLLDIFFIYLNFFSFAREQTKPGPVHEREEGEWRSP